MICQTKDVFSVYLVISSFSPNKEKTLEIEIGFYLDETDVERDDETDDYAEAVPVGNFYRQFRGDRWRLLKEANPPIIPLCD